MKNIAIYSLVLIIQGGIYRTTGFLNTLPSQALRTYELSMVLDSKIPFIAEAIWFYCLYYLLLLSAFMFAFDEAVFRPFIRSFIFMSLVADLLFVLIPVVMPLPSLGFVSTDTSTYALLDFILKIDTRSNCFPSLHCAHGFLISFWASRSHLFPSSVRVLLVLMTNSVVAATLLVKQHWLLDILGAYLLFDLIRKVYEKKLQHQRV